MGLFTSISEQLEQGRTVALARIIHLTGSGPRSVGAACIVLDDGRLIGTVGGGSLEHQVHQVAKQVVLSKESVLFKLEMSGEDVSASRMICGGSVAAYIEPLTSANSETMAVYRSLAHAEQAGHRGRLITLVQPSTPADAVGQRRVLTSDGEDVGRLEIPSHLLDDPDCANPKLITNDSTSQKDLFITPIQGFEKVIIFGGGHVSACLAPLLKPLGFSVVVVDDRQEFANEHRFPNVDQIYSVPFRESFTRIHMDTSSYIVIVTRGHLHDKDVLAESLQHPSAYIGMIGSRRKGEMIYNALLKEGITQTQLDAVYSPIGIDILAETPEEIAISIVAELIRVRAERRVSKR